MLKIRLTRRGKKNKAFFRLVLAEHTSPIKGKFIEVLGFVNPHTKEKKFEEDRIRYWIEKGAQCSETVHNLLVGSGIVKGPKRAIKMKKKPVEEAKAPVSNASQSDAGAEKKPEVKNEEKKEEVKAPEAAQSEAAEKAPETVSEAVPEAVAEVENSEKKEEIKENLAA